MKKQPIYYSYNTTEIAGYAYFDKNNLLVKFDIKPMTSNVLLKLHHHKTDNQPRPI